MNEAQTAALVAELDQIHSPDRWGIECLGCGLPHPCPTRDVIEKHLPALGCDITLAATSTRVRSGSS